MIINIDDNTVAIEDAIDLSNVVTVNNNITHIHFAKDITLTQGITINPNRMLLVLDGEYPLNSGAYHTFTDMYSVGEADTLGIRAESGIQMTLRNMSINGRNFYGVPYVMNSSTTKNLSITYENVVYKGRQITYNRHGTTRYIDCDITISNVGTWAGEEVGEVSKVEIGGKTTIRKQNNANSTFWFCGDMDTNSFKILAGAEVEITTVNYFMFLLRTADIVSYIIEPNASFKLITNTGLSYSNVHRAASFYVGENASFEYFQNTANGANASLSMTGTLTVRPNARFFMRADYSNIAPLIRFRTNEASKNLSIENPKSFVLYKMGTPALLFDYTREFLLSGGQVNYWQNAIPFPNAGTFDDYPLYPWHNTDWSSFEINGSAGTTNISTTLTPPVSPEITKLQLQNAAVLSVGVLPLTIDPVLNNNTPVSGKSDPFANIRVEYTDDGGAHTFIGTADGDGIFSIPTLSPIPLDTVVTVSANTPFLYITKTEVSQEAGSLTLIEAPKRIKFISPPLSQAPPKIIGRDNNTPIVVSDTRVYSTRWELVATLDAHLHTTSGRILPGNVVFVPPNAPFDDLDPLDVGVSKRVYTGGPNVKKTNVSWINTCGLLVQLTGPIRLGEEYNANITWTVNPI